MIDLSRSGFTTEEVLKALHAAKRKVDFRYELLDYNYKLKKSLTNIINGNINNNSKETIKRVANLEMTDDNDIDFLSDRIKIYIRFFVDNQKMSPAFRAFLSSNFPAGFKKQMLGKSDWIEFPQGVFLLTSPERTEENESFTREVECYDGLLIPFEEGFEDRHYIPAGMYIHDAVVEILLSSGIPESMISIQQSDKVVEFEKEYESGKSKLEAINEILKSGVYEELHCDAEGNYVANLYVSPLYLPADYSYKTDRSSVVFGGYKERLDYYNVPNRWIVTRTVADRPPLISMYTNDNPDSPTSTVRRGGRIITKKETVDDVHDQQTLDLYTQRIAFEDSQVFGEVTYESGIMPFHDFENILDLQFDGIINNGKYVEVEWDMKLEVGGKMLHKVKQVVSV